MLNLLKNEVFWVLALGINIFFSIVKPVIRPYANKITSNKMTKQHIYWLIIIAISHLSVYILHRYDNLPLIDSSIFLTSMWTAFTSIFIYSLGIDFVFGLLKEKLAKKG